ncbi:hypothetical protein EJ05DRAFT_534114 [Pseudovirgaria hyperparasitica]|uniref:Chromosome condensation protein n=1 Tax=Pseudovirgaria hyperparasitica TaxID=470096 RepID=A0A6A6WK93_9PEZI|nr:uncharacterized protein EJ05DRAFT_534114 [Pseudovirgaria hyperparasitica]KAF2762585.1 hypothetical protein EJ05DRAFT_534114 [Pseudovirgaria hyperparasitica]
MKNRESPPPSQRHGHYEQQRFLRPASPFGAQTASSHALSPQPQPQRSEADSEEYQGLNEILVSSLGTRSESSWYKHHSLEEERPRRHADGGIGSNGGHGFTKRHRVDEHNSTVDEYNEPKAFGNLDEEIDVNVDGQIRSHGIHGGTYLEDARRKDLGSQGGQQSFKSGRNTRPPSRNDEHNLTALPRPHTGRSQSVRSNFGPTTSSDLKPKADTHLNKPPSHGVSRFATELYTVSYLIFFSILGTLARLGTQWLVFYPGAPVATSVLWANFGGSLLMGFLAEERQLFAHEWGSPAHDTDKASHLKTKKTIPLYIGLATGFCGCYTSFSAFMRDAFLALSNDLPTPLSHPFSGPGIPSSTNTTPRHNVNSLAAVLAVLILTISLCLSALSLGAHIASLTARFTPTVPHVVLRRILDPLAVILGWGSWIGAIILCAYPPADHWRGEALFACVFAPLGCLLRFGLSLWLNPISPSFPLGTFASNILGTAVLGMAWDLQHLTSLVGGGVVGCQVLQGVMDGFDGSLTTVSTWVVELKALRKRHAYVYGAVSVGLGLGVLVGVMGGVRWGVGWEGVVCVTGRNF